MSATTREPKLGASIVYCDSRGNDCDALITAVWSPTCVNVLFVSVDESKQDNYGRQIERETSVTHATVNGQAHGRYWRFADEPRNEYRPPVAV